MGILLKSILIKKYRVTGIRYGSCTIFVRLNNVNA